MPTELRFGPFWLDRANQSLRRGGKEIPLPPKALAVLLHLADRPGSLVTKNELLDAVWGDIHVTEGVLKRSVAEIRRALEDPADEPRYIQTLHRRGYRFLPASALAERPSELPARRPPAVVGREREFESLDASFHQALEGFRQIVFITGEGGLGKTTLVDNWLSALASRDTVSVGRGRCLQQFGSGEPYLPVFEALEQLSRSLGSRLVAILRTHAPTWLLHMPSLISLEDHVRLRDEVFGTTRDRMLREITGTLEVLSAGTPIVLVLEDLHWSDPSTIDFLTSIATRNSAAQLMILATCRPAGFGGSSHLGRIQHELELHGQCRLLPLSYLTERDIHDYLASRFSEPDSHAVLTGPIHRRTSGNPLFVTCLVEEMVRSGSIDLAPEAIREMVPNTLQIMFEHQADQLTELEREIVDAAAVEGELFSTASIAAALRRDQPAVEASCEALVKRQVVLKRAEPIRFPDGVQSPRYSFLHVLCRDALYRRLPPGLQSRLHGSLGSATEALFASDPPRVASELAGHFEFAGEFPKAIRYLRLAADGAASRFAIQEAARHLEHAIQLVERVEEANQASLRMDLLEQRAIMRLSTMDLEGSAADFAAVEAQARLVGNVNRQVKALLDSAMPWAFLDFPRVLAILEGAGRLKFEADPVLAAVVDASRSGTGVYFYGWRNDLEDLFNRASLILSSENEPWIRFRFRWMESFVRYGASDYARSHRAAEQSRHYARKVGIFHQYFLATHYFIMSLINLGNLGEAIRTARDDAGMAATNHHLLEQFWLESLEAVVAIEAFAFERAQAICERLTREPVLMSFNLTPHVLLWLGLARLGAGAIDGASEAFDRMETAVETGSVGFEFRFPLLEGQASCALARGDTGRARSLIVRSIELAEEHRTPGCAARGYRLLSKMASQAGDHAAAVEHISAAMAALKGFEILNVEWQVYATAATALAVVGRHSESQQARAHGIHVGERVVATLDGEPALRQSLLTAIRRHLGESALTARS